MNTIDLDATDAVIAWPASVDAPLKGWHWGRHVSLGAAGEGYYMLRDLDGVSCIAIMRPDLRPCDVPSEKHVLAEIAYVARVEVQS